MNEVALKEAFLNSRIQQMHLSQDGTILASDDVLFLFNLNQNIADAHPFFEGLVSLLPELTERITFPCVNILIQGKKKILDIEVVRNENEFFILLFDFTQHYIDSQPLIQEKNEAAIAREHLIFEKRLLMAKENFKNEFLAHLNHEIRNPLNNMLGFMEILRDSKLNYNQNETLKVMQRTGTQIKQLMEDMLDISRIERGVISVQYVPFNLGHIITNLQQHFQLKFASQSANLEVHINENVPKKLLGDPVRLNQILFNLLENAFRHTAKASVLLTISAVEKKKDTCVLSITVSDTGIGIAKDKLDAIFDSYYQLKVSAEKPLGEGLGLKIVKDLVELLKGKITVSSDASGTVFTSEIPFNIRVIPDKRPTVPKGSGILLSKRILAVEDKETAQMLFMRTFLNNDRGFILEIASSAAHAFSLMEKRAYNLIIFKNKLPDSSAVDFITKAKNNTNEEIANIPILIASGSTMVKEQLLLLEAGASGFLAKPYTQKELFDSIEKLHS